MSAIFGIIDLQGRPIEPAWIKSMQTDLAHRGPDGQGLYQEESMFLGHMLLQVTPESVYDKSPYEEDGFVITAYARLDEREAIMDRIGTPADERDKITDGLLLLRSFKKFGKDFVKDIYGDFAFAIWDKEKKELFCARDQIGVKPFLYYYQDGRFVFSTELKAIVKLPFIKTTINQYYRRDVTIGLEDISCTTWLNIFRLKPANILELKKQKAECCLYWSPKYKRNKKLKAESESASTLRKLIEKSIADKMRTNGMIGLTLSGGLDSNTIACFAAKKLNSEGKNLISVSSILGATNSDINIPDELEYVNNILDQEKNIDSMFIYHSDLSLIDNIEEQFNFKYSPVNDYHYVDSAFYDKFKSRNVRRIMTGYLGDETISFSSLKPMTNLFYSGRLLTFVRLINKLKKNSNQTYLNLINSHILFPIMPKLFLKFYFKIKANKINEDIDIFNLPFNIEESEINVIKKKQDLDNNYRVFNGITENIWMTGKDHFEEEWDCRASHYQIEITYPFADRRIIEFLLQVPFEHFFANGLRRGLIKKAMEGILPDKIRKRSDKGYFSPGFVDILKKDHSKLKSIIEIAALNDITDGLINYEKISRELEKINNPDVKSINFDGNYLILHQLIIWLAFNNWIVKQDTLLNTSKMKKQMKKEWSTPKVKHVLSIKATYKGNGTNDASAPSTKKS